jgi:hypothetical protein
LVKQVSGSMFGVFLAAATLSFSARRGTFLF